MPTINKTQTSFSGGIVSTELLGRIDFDKLSNGVKECENFLVRPIGGVQYAAGTEYLCESRENARLIPFIESIDVAYCLEFSENLIRVINRTGVLAEITSDYLSDEVKDIKHAQYKNELYLTHKNHKPKILKHNYGVWYLEEMQFNNKLNVDDLVTSFSIASGAHDSSPAVNYDKWQYAISFVDGELNESLAKKSNIITNDISLATQPIAVTAEINIEECLRNDIKYAYFYKVRGGNFYFVQKMPIEPEGLVLEYKAYAGDSITTADTYYIKDDTVYIKENGSFVVPEYTSLLSQTDEKIEIRVLNRYHTLLRDRTKDIYSESGRTSTLSFQDAGLAVDESTSIQEPFTDFDTENPKVCSFFNQRLILAGTESYPNDIWGSRVGKFNDFRNTENVLSDEAFNLTLSSGTLDAIQHIVPLDTMIVFSSGKIWRISGTSAYNMQADIESYSTISDLVPSATKKSILYIDASLNTVSNFVYSYELNGYVGQNLDILARELFDGQEFIAQSFRNNPFPVMFVVRDDGIILALTYLREENIYAWSKLTTQGKYKDICCLNTKKNDTIYTIVERKNGTFIEVFADQITSDQNVEDSCYLHSSKIITNNASDTITGLDWLAGMTVDILADKNVYKDVPVDENGTIIASGLSEHSRLVIGLSYRGVLQTIPFEMISSAGSSSIGLQRRIKNATLTYYKTRGLKYGTSLTGLTEIKPYTQQTFAEDIPLETGKFNLPVSSSWDMETTFYVVQDYPLPCFLQNITLEIYYGNKN